MLTEIWVDFPTADTARTALTRMRRQYRVALRGSVAIDARTMQDWRRVWRLHVALDGSGFSGAEFASAVRQFNLHSEVAQCS